MGGVWGSLKTASGPTCAYEDGLEVRCGSRGQTERERQNTGSGQRWGWGRDNWLGDRTSILNSVFPSKICCVM